LRAVGLARFAPLGLVLEALVGEKHLFARGENELRPTFGALQDLIVVFHVLLRDLAGTGQAAVKPTSDEGIRWGILRFPPADWHDAASMDPSDTVA
jgi:hypothetical protein